MTWSTKAKRNYYWARRKKATESYVQAANLLGSSVKRARIKARKDMTREYGARKKIYHEADKIDRQIIRLQSKPKLSKSQTRKLQRLEKKHKTLVVKATERWSEFEHKINWKPVGDEDERSKRDTP